MKNTKQSILSGFIRAFILILVLSHLVFVSVISGQENVNLSHLGSWEEGPGAALYVDNNTAYINSGSIFKIFDITDPESPVQKGQYTSNGFIESIEVKDNFAYIALNNLGLLTLDITEPDNIKKKAFIELPGFRPATLVIHEYLYYAVYDKIYVLDISDPANPSLTSTLETNYRMRQLKKHNNVIVGAAGWDGVIFIDYSDPQSIEEIKIIKNDNTYYYDIDFKEHTAYIATSDSILIFNISDLENPQQINSFYSKNSTHLAPKDNLLFIIKSSAKSLQIWDISDNNNPVVLNDYYSLDAGADEISLNGEYIHTISSVEYMLSIDISNISEIQQYKSTVGSSYSLKTYVRGDTAIIAQPKIGYALLDISDPTSPAYTGNYLMGEFSHHFHIEDNYMYTLYDGLKVYDISNLQNPLLLNELYLSSNTKHLIAKDNKLFISDYSNGLRIIDISNPLQPVELSLFETEGKMACVDIVDQIAYAITNSEGLKIIDIQDPLNPVELGTIDDIKYSNYIKIIGNYAYIGGYSSFSKIVDISDPENPVRIDGNIGSRVRHIALSDNLAFVSSDSKGYFVYDVSDPSSPIQLAEFKTKGQAQYSVISEDKIYIADYNCGITILEYDTTGTFTWDVPENKDHEITDLHIYPNPASDQLLISFDLKKASNVSIDLINTNGTVVSQVFNKEIPGGKSKITEDISWLTPGIYYCLIKVDKQSRVLKIAKD